MNFKSILRLILRGLGVAGLFVLVLELGARIDDLIQWDVPLDAAYSHEGLYVTDSLGRHNRPNAQFEKWRINSHGFRGPDISLKKGDKTRIVVVGASEAFGLYESPGMEFSAQMQKMLDTKNPGNYQVLNAASAGMTPTRIAHYYENWIELFDPDILIFYPSPSFYLDIKPPPSRIESRPTPLDATELTGLSFRLKRKVMVVLKRFIPETIQVYIMQMMIERYVNSNPVGWVFESPSPERLQLFREHVSALIEQIKRSGTKVVLATHANRFSVSLDSEDRRHLRGWRKFFPRASEDCLLVMDSAANNIILELGRQHQVSVVDISSLVPKSREHFADFAHFTDEGARLVASALTDEVLRIAPAVGALRQSL